MDKHEKELQQAHTALQFMGVFLRNRRLDLRMSLTDVALCTGLTQKKLHKIEQGVDTGDAADLMEVAQTLKVDFVALLQEALKYGKTHYNTSES